MTEHWSSPNGCHPDCPACAAEEPEPPTGHTPGPWHVVGDEIHDRLCEFEETGARIGNTPNSICEVHNVPSSIGTKEANARLIAKAPVMLEALQEAWNVICYAAQEAKGRVDQKKVGGWIHHAAKINALIMQAKGETP